MTSAGKLVDDYRDELCGLGCLNGEHHIKMRDDAKPVVHSARRVIFRLQSQFKAQLEEMEGADNQGYGTDGMGKSVGNTDEVRSVIEDMFGSRTADKEHFAIHTAEEIFAKLHSSRYVSILDATSGFIQIALDEESSYLTAFATPFGKW